ncbi:TPA: hypothetical protein ACMDOZ_002226 [Vibrio cholerae]
MNCHITLKKIHSLFTFTTLLLVSPIAAAAPISLVEIIANGSRLMGLAGFTVALYGVFWGIVSSLKAWKGLQHGADQQQDPEIMKKFTYRMISGLGAATTIGIMLATILALFGTTEVLNFITFDAFTTKSFLQIDF